VTELSKPTTIAPRHAESQFAGDPDIVATAMSMGVTTVESASEIPESLRWVAGGTPGLLFWHHPLGGGAAVPQLRPDVPDGPKYVFAKNSGSVISIAPKMQERLDADVARACRVLILEGTKQMIFGASYADESTIVVGIQGCWGFSQDGLALASLDNLCSGRDVVVGFDADISSNQNVYDAADSLTTAVMTIGAKSVNFLKVPGSKKIGIDDYLARRPPDNRRMPLMNMIESAVGIKKIRKPPRQTARKDVNGLFDFISFELGEVVQGAYENRDPATNELDRDQVGLAVAGEIDGRTVRRVSTYLCAAPRIVSRIQLLDDLSPGVEPQLAYDVDIQIGPASNCEHHIVTNISSSNLVKVRRWLDRAGTVGGDIAFGPAGQMSNGPAKIEDAMRGLLKESDVETRTSLTRTGWYQHTDGAPHFVDSTGAHSKDGKVDLIRGQLEGPAAGVSIPGFLENYTVEDANASAREIVNVTKYLYDPTVWICGISAIWWSICSGNPDAVLFIAGGAGSGKSSIAEALASMLGPKWGTGMSGMSSVEGTTSYLSDVTKGIHNMVLILDDARERSSLKGQESQDTALDAVIRIGYSGGGAARGRKVVDSTGTWKQSVPSLNRPFVILVGEALPDSSPASTIERCLVVAVDAKTSLRKAAHTPDGVSGHAHLVDISRSGALRAALSHSIYRMASNIDAGLRAPIGDERHIHNIDAVRQEMEAIRLRVLDEAMDKYWPMDTPASERSRNVTGTFLAGAELFCGYLESSNALPASEIAAIRESWRQAIVRAAVDHSQVNLKNSSRTHTSLEKLQGALKSGRYCLGEPTKPGQITLGKRVKVHVGADTVACVALIPKVVSEVLGSHAHVERQLADILVRGTGGTLKRKVNLDGDRIWCLVFSEADFWMTSESDGDGDEDDSDDDVATEDF